MANMTKNGTTGRYELPITPSSSAQTKRIKVAGKYCDCDIDVKVSAQEEVFDMSKTFTVSTSNIYYIDGRCKIEISNGTYKSSAIIENTYFQLYSKSEGTNTCSLTYRIPGHIVGSTSSVSFPNWVSNQIATAGGSLSITLYYNKGSLFKCSTSSSYTSYTSTATTTEQKVNNYLRREVLYIYNYTSAGSGSTGKYSLLTYPFIKITKVERSTNNTAYYSNATSNVYYSYSEDGTNWTSSSVTAYNSSSGGQSVSTSCTIRGYYYAFTERL